MMRRIWLSILLGGAAALSGCEFGKTTIGIGTSTVVVHAVLNPMAAVEEILVERALTGASFVDTSLGYDPSEPISSGGGIPISRAMVVIYGPDGDSVVAREGFGNGEGDGVYLIANSAADGMGSNSGSPLPSFPFVAGNVYRLRITTSDDETVTGTTHIPEAPPSFDSVTAAQPFDRTRDTLSLGWPMIQSARSYLVQVSTPFNTYETLIDTLGYRIAGETRNAQARTLPHLFIPGFTQLAIVGAVDSNFYDYERFRTDVSSTSTRINHLVGGLGIFGAYVPLLFREVAVTAPMTLPIEGSYTSTGSNAAAPAMIQLYEESAPGDNGLAQISGSYLQSNGATGGVIGVFDGTHITLDILDGESVLDTTAIVDGTVHAGSITGAFRSDGSSVTYTKSPPPG